MAPIFQQPALNKLLVQQPSNTVYHYTTQAGMKGIIESKAIWATHHQCLNDSKEFSLCRELLTDELNTGSAYPTALRDGILNDLHGAGYEDVNLFLASFTARPDSLSQWRGYGGSSSAFSIGFDLASVVLHPRFRFAECIYEPNRQRKVIKAIIQEYADTVAANPGSGPTTLRFCFHTFALMLKDESFEEEKEWRIISEVLSDIFPLTPPATLNFRPGPSMLIPYRILPLTRSDESLALTEVIVGPSPTIRQSERSVQSLVDTHGLASVSVKPSRVPYRTW